MELHQLRCFVAAAEELHFGRAARRLEILPSALSRHLRLLEEGLGTRLFTRTTRNVVLTEDGSDLLHEVRPLLSRMEIIERRFRKHRKAASNALRLGTIDTAAAGLVPLLVSGMHKALPEAKVQITEGKTIKLLPLLLSGRLDLALVRPPEKPDPRLQFQFLLHETAVVAVPRRHPLARRKVLRISDLASTPLIVPDRRSRPHSHDLTMKLFAAAGLVPNIVQIAEEKQTIVSLVAAGIGLAIVPRWSNKFGTAGVKFLTLKLPKGLATKLLPLAVAWPRNARDVNRDKMIALLLARNAHYAKTA